MMDSWTLDISIMDIVCIFLRIYYILSIGLHCFILLANYRCILFRIVHGPLVYLKFTIYLCAKFLEL